MFDSSQESGCHIIRYLGRHAGKFVALPCPSHDPNNSPGRKAATVSILGAAVGFSWQWILIRPILERSPFHVRIELLLRVWQC